MLRFVELGAGLAIVNGCVRIPRALVALPMRELPRVRYEVFTRTSPTPHAAALARCIRAHGASWMTSVGVRQRPSPARATKR
jgi:hypothetical protein